MDIEQGFRDADTAAVLIVDDSRLSARKIALAVSQLGHQFEIAESGVAALDLLERMKFDVILLDIVMPEMDGYEVLRRLKADGNLQHVPVIVISSLDDDIASIVKAIELGAEDFLPKSFEPEILRARLDTSLARKRFRDRELEDLARVEQLTQAAQVIESGSFHPSDLDIDQVARSPDAIGRLAGVFRNLADEVYFRERQLDQAVRTLRGIILVVVAGVILGVRPTFARMIAAEAAPVLGVAFWSALAGGLFCLCLAVVRDGWPRFRLAHLGFLLGWSVIFGCFYQIALILISGHVEASVINVVMGSRGFLVFALAAILALERPSLRRLSGLLVGFSAIAVILLLDGTVGGETDRMWLVATLVLPMLLAIHTLLMSYRSVELGALAVAGAMLTVSAALIAPFAFTSDAILWAGWNAGYTWALIALLGIATGVGFVVSLEVVRTAGPVFGGQVAYSQTLAGVVWAMLFLGERPAAILFAAIALVIFGFFLVEPKRAGQEFRATLPRGRKFREKS